MSNVKIQIYGIRKPEDARMVVDLGADHIGVIYGKVRWTDDQLTLEQAKAIFDSVPQAVKVGLTIGTDLEEMVETVTLVRPDVLHLSGDIELFPPENVALLRQRVPDLKIMQAIPVNHDNALQFVKEFESVSDFFLLDTRGPGRTDIGATGLTHDWALDKQIVQATRVPCIMAGGLGAENVADAIRFVQPWGVDSMTRTNLESPQPRMSFKDPEKVRAFIDAVRGA